jgi:hypothetical protein
VVSFTLRLLYTREKILDTRWLGGWVGLRAIVDALREKKTPSLPLPGIEPLPCRPQPTYYIMQLLKFIFLELNNPSRIRNL